MEKEEEKMKEKDATSVDKTIFHFISDRRVIIMILSFITRVYEKASPKKKLENIMIFVAVKRPLLFIGRFLWLE